MGSSPSASDKFAARERSRAPTIDELLPDKEASRSDGFVRPAEWEPLTADEPRVIEVFPDRGLSTGGYALFVEGTNFWNTSSIACDVDGYKVKGADSA